MPLMSFVRLVAAVLFLGVAVGAPLGAAQAGNTRPVPYVERDPNPTPSTPEPTGLLVFGVGVGLVAWRVGRSRRS